MSRFPPWHFRSMDLGEVQVDPVHDEFFKAQDLADALVRESIQNSLDARLSRSRSPVSVRFRFASGAQALPAEGVREYFEGLEGHLRAAAKSIHTVLPRDDEAVPYLLIEDSGTRGLTGDPRADPELDHPGEERKNDFYYFWRNVGRSSKGTSTVAAGDSAKRSSPSPPATAPSSASHAVSTTIAPSSSDNPF